MNDSPAAPRSGSDRGVGCQDQVYQSEDAKNLDAAEIPIPSEFEFNLNFRDGSKLVTI